MDPRIIITEGAQDLATKGAGLFLQKALQCNDRQGHFVAAFSGGSTPRAMNRLLVQEPFLSGIPWKNIHLFWVDERMVPYDDPDSNYGAARTDFIDAAPISPDKLHPIPVGTRPEKGAELYEEELRLFFRRFKSDYPSFDLLLLGIGEDGHTASLFPDHPALGETRRWVVQVKGGVPDVHRITLTYPVINRAATIIFLASGRQKASVLKTIMEDPNPQLPAQRIRPESAEVIWLVDRDAAALLSEEIITSPSGQEI